ncbi:MAG: NAD(P)H-hydrate dehydratase, partial [Chloroflexi bacterium]
VWKRNVAADKNWSLLDNTGVDRVFAGESNEAGQLGRLLNESAVIVDALLGTGVSRPISGSLAELLARAKSVADSRRAPQNPPLTEPGRPDFDPAIGPVVVAVDVPSGLNSDTGAVDPYTLPADLTVTLAAVKRGHVLQTAPNVVGKLVVGDIGITAEHYPADVSLQMVTAADVAQLLPARPATAHKGTFGTALVVAGSIYYVGAAALAGQAATRIGTGLVTMALPETICPAVSSRLAEATYLPLPDDGGFVSGDAPQVLRQKFGRAGALLIGPGLGHTTSTAAFLSKLLENPKGLPPLILDADALNILADRPAWWQSVPSQSILTPHPGEMARLMKSTTSAVQAARLEVAAEMAAQWQQVVLLKGAHTVVAAPDGRVRVLPFANSAMAKGGSGDVLAGAIVGLRAQGMASFDAAVAGAYLHGLAGELAREQVGVTSVVAGDLVSLLPLAIRDVRGE